MAMYSFAKKIREFEFKFEMEEIEYFIVDSNWDSLLTAVFESFSRKLRPRSLLRRNGQSNLFEVSCPVIGADRSKSKRVWQYICGVVDPILTQMMVAAHSVGNECIDSAIFRVICKIADGRMFSVGDYSDSDMADILWGYRQAQRSHCAGRRAHCRGV